MNADRDADAILAAWLDDGPAALPDDTRRAITVGLRTTPQRRGRFGWLAGSRRGSMPPNTLRLAAAVAAVVLVPTIAVTLWQGGLPNLVGATSSPSASAEPSLSPSAPASVTPTPSSPFGLEVGPGAQAEGTIVFQLHEPSSSESSLYAVAPDGSDLRVLLEGAVCCPVVSPDGQWVVAAQEDRVGRMVPQIINLGRGMGGRWDDFAPGISLVPGAWGANAIAFEGWAEGDPDKTGIYLSVGSFAVVVPREMRRLTSSPGDLPDVPIGFSPDGTKLLFIRAARDGAGDLYVIGVDGSGLRQLNPTGELVTFNDAFGAGASWAPDGQRVAFAAFDRTSTAHVYVASIDGGDATAITDRSYTTSARWSPDGEWIAYDVDHQPWDSFRDPWLVRPDGSDAHGLAGPRSSCCGVWSPDSEFLLALGEDPDVQGLFIVRADGSGFDRLLTVSAATEISWRGWGPPRY